MVPFPTRRLFILIALPALLSLGLIVDDDWLPALLLLDLGVLLAAGADALLGLPRARRLTVDWSSARTWSLGRGESLHFALANPGRRGWRITATPDVPSEFTLSEREREVVLPGRSRAEIEFVVTARERGTWRLDGLHVSVTSRLGLWTRQLRIGEPRTIHVYPNLKQLGEYALLARTNRLSLIGVRSARRVGGDTEFERLRDWHSDDGIGRVDWKATARRDQLIVRDYQANQSQTIMLLVDAGRMMAGRSPGADGREASLLDHAIDAALMLAFVALRQNDRVGLIAYADGVRRWVPARGGTRQLNRLIHALHDLQPELVESRHEEAFVHLERKERKRSLVVAFTHVLDDVNAGHLERHLANLVGRHLPLAVLLQDADLHAQLRSAPSDVDGMWKSAAAATIANWRGEVIGSLRKKGALVLDVAPERLTAEVVSGYLKVKAKHLL
ncbi:MAG: DUF58 domain-containing protein [Planctomycetes bacterium]|nr:DUF58 domain-containing protein [Planctomycetota bacterium]